MKHGDGGGGAVPGATRAHTAGGGAPRGHAGGGGRQDWAGASRARTAEAGRREGTQAGKGGPAGSARVRTAGRGTARAHRQVGFCAGSAAVSQGGPRGTQTGNGGGGSKPEGSPGVVEAVRVRESDIAAGGGRLRVAALHVEDGLRYPGFRGDGESSHTARGAGEGRGVDADGAEGGGDHGGDEGR